MWHLKWGTREYDKLFKLILEDTGVPHPAHASKPTLRSDCIRYYDAFRHLSVSRLWNQVGPQPIQINEIHTYLNLVGIEDTSTKLKYLRLIQTLDNVERDFIAQQQSQKAKHK